MKVCVAENTRLTDHLAAVVDPRKNAHLASKRPKVSHHTLLPEEGMKGWKAQGRIWSSGRLRPANELTKFVQSMAITVIPTQRAQLLHHAFFPEEGPRDQQSSVRIDCPSFCPTDDLRAAVDANRQAVVPSQRAEAVHHSRVPEKGSTN